MAFAATTRTNYTDFLKELYQGSYVADLTFDSNLLLGLLKKNPNTGGTKYVKPVKYTYNHGRSAVYATARGNVAAPSRERWEMDWTDGYAVAGVDNKALELSRGAGSAGSFKDLLVDETDSTYRGFANDVEIELHRDGTGARGQATGAISGTEIPLRAGEAVNFEPGMVIERYDDSVGGWDGTTKTITAVDFANDTISIASDWTPATAASDYFAQEGDKDAKANGLEAWLPGSTVTGTAFNGVDRSVSKAFLAGVDGVKGTTSGLLITDSLVSTAAAILKLGGRPNLALISPEDYADFCLETEDRARYAKLGATTGSVSFSGMEIQTGAGAVPVMPDRHVRSDTGWMLDTRSIEVYSTNTLPSMFDKDGNFYHRELTADELSFYIYGFYGMCIQTPGHNAQIKDMY